MQQNGHGWDLWEMSSSTTAKKKHNLAFVTSLLHILGFESLLEMVVLTGQPTTIHFLPWDVCVTPSLARSLGAQPPTAKP